MSLHSNHSPFVSRRFANRNRYVFVLICLVSVQIQIQNVACAFQTGTAVSGTRVTDTPITVQPKEKRVVETGFRGKTQAERYLMLAKKANEYQKQNGLIREIFEVCEPTVVHIEAQKEVSKNGSSPVRIEEAGAGFIFQYRGKFHIVTNRHLIHDAKTREIRIQLSDGRFFRPTEIRSDRDSDLAVLYTNETELVSARVGDSDSVKIGDFVVAVGSPFGLNHSVSLGIVSAKGRRDLDLGASGVRLQDFMQTDAAINPGNSGGPLMNLSGEVIGINTAIASNSGHNEGIGFTIPINMAMRIANDLVDYGKVRRGLLGVSLDSRFTPERAESIGLNSVYGARITSITPGSPASETDLKIGDVILKYNDKVIENDSHLVGEVSMTPDGTQVSITYFRGGKMRKTLATIRGRDK